MHSQKFSKIFFRTLNTFVTLTFSLFEICSCQRFLLSKFLASAFLVTFVENELSLQPSLFETSSLLIHTPANVVSQLIDNNA